MQIAHWLILVRELELPLTKTNMADVEDFLSQSYSFVHDFFFKGLVALAVLLIVTLLTKMFSDQGYRRHPGSDDTNFCSSPECLRCSHRKEATSFEVVSKKLDEFVRIRGDRAGLERLYKGVECYRTQEDRNDSLSAQKPTVFYFDGLAPKPWHDYYSAQLSSLISSANFELIKSEFQEIRFHASEGWFKNSTLQGEWSVYHLINQGETVKNNCSACPKTMEIIESVVPLLKGCSFGNVLFSILQAGTHITAHYGPTNWRIRCHLPLFVPKGCVLCVDGQNRRWREGELLLFDDSFLHEAWHKGTDGERVVLMLDLWHPELTMVEREALAYMFPPHIQGQLKKKQMMS